MTCSRAVRNCFLEPIPALDQAVALLDDAANALLAGDRVRAAQLVAAADLPEIGTYCRTITGKIDAEIHGVTKLPPSLKRDERMPVRMPSTATEAMVFLRDGWRCRFCGIRVISRLARKAFTATFPVEAHWEQREYQRHCALLALSASLDHVHPHSRGGDNDEANLVTACWTCQFGRGNLTLHEAMLNDPRDRPPIMDGWDGLTRLVGATAISNLQLPFRNL